MRPSILQPRRRLTLISSYALPALLRPIIWVVLRAQDNINSNLLILNSSHSQHMVAPRDLKTSASHQGQTIWPLLR